MKYKYLYLMLLTAIASIAQQGSEDKAEIEAVLNLWHKAAAEAKFKPYFAMMTDNAVFIGTDPTENWQLDAFKTFAKPYFDKGKAWNFTAVERHVYFSDKHDIAWFDELLDTQMKLCRGSGVMEKQNGKWKIAHYVLSMTVPNVFGDEVTKLKSDFDSELLKKLLNRK